MRKVPNGTSRSKTQNSSDQDPISACKTWRQQCMYSMYSDFKMIILPRFWWSSIVLRVNMNDNGNLMEDQWSKYPWIDWLYFCVFAVDSFSSIHLFNRPTSYTVKGSITCSFVIALPLKGSTYSQLRQHHHHRRRVTPYSTTTMSDKRSERMLEELLKVPGNSKSDSIPCSDHLFDNFTRSLLCIARDLLSVSSQLADK